MKRPPQVERPLTAAPHDRPRHIDDGDPDEPESTDLDELPLDEALRRMGWR
jgi:hypothetical protein